MPTENVTRNLFFLKIVPEYEGPDSPEQITFFGPRGLETHIDHALSPDVRVFFHNKEWLLSEPERSEDGQFLLGQVGYEKPNQTPTGEYDSQSLKFVEYDQSYKSVVYAHFALHYMTRQIVVESHRELKANMSRRILERFLNAAPTPSRIHVRFVPGISFPDWLDSAGAIKSFSLTADRPNPTWDDYPDWLRSVLRPTLAAKATVWLSTNELLPVLDLLQSNIAEQASRLIELDRVHVKATSTLRGRFRSKDNYKNRTMSFRRDPDPVLDSARRFEMMMGIFHDEFQEDFSSEEFNSEK